MKPRLQLAFQFFIAITMVQSTSAATGTWTGGTNGTWNTTDTNWSGLVAGFPWDATNGKSNDAIFNTASLAATVSGPVFTNGITFTTGGSLTGSTINLAGTTPFIDVASAQTGTIASIIAGSAGLNKLGTGTLTLQGANTFSGGLAVKAGTVLINPQNGVTNPLGTGTVTIGDSANTDAAATLWLSAPFGFGAFANPLVSTGTGTNILGVTGWNPTFTGGLTLSNHLTIASNNGYGSNFNINGGVTGTGNIIVSINNSSNDSFVNFGTAAVNNSGTLTYNNAAVTIGSVTGVVGTGTGTNNITGGVGSNVTAITQASNSNPLTISTNALTVNAGGTTLTASGTAQFTVSSSVTGTGNLILNTNNNTRGILLSGTAVNHTGTITNSGTGTAFTTISAGIGSSVTGLTQNSSTSGLILSGTNTYTGGTSVTAGAVYFRNTNAKSASGTHAFSAGTTLGLEVATSGAFFNSTDIDNAFAGGTMTGNLSNVTVTATTNVAIDTTQGDFTHATSVIGSPTKSLTKLGTNTLTLTGTNTYTGATMIGAGTLRLGDGGTTGSLATTSTITNNGTFTVNRSNAVVQGTDFTSAAISGTGSFIQAGSGTTTLSSASYTGGTTVNAGRLRLVNTSTGSSNFVTHAELEFNLTNNNRTLSGGSITGTGNLIKTGGSVLVLNNVQRIELTGATSIIDVQGGVLRNDNGNGNSNASVWGNNRAGLTVASGAIFDIWDGTATVDELNGAGIINKGWDGDRTLNIGKNDGSGTFSGTILNNATNLGYGGKGGGNLLLVKHGSGTQILSGNNTYAGTTTISGGTLQIGAGTDAGSISSSGSILNNGALVYNVGSGTRTSNAISGSGSLTQNSFGGNLTLSGLNAYTGATLVSAGALTVSGAGTLSGTTALTVSNGGRFNYLPTTVGTTLTLGTGSTLALNSGSIIGLSWNASSASRIAVSGAATIGTGSGVALDLSGTFTSGQAYTILTAGSGLDTGSYKFANATNYSATVSQTATAVTVTPTTQSALTTVYWKGGLSGSTNAWALSDGTTSNWVSDLGGTATALVPGSGADVTISAASVTTAPTATVLGADMTIKSLTIADTVNGLGLNADGSRLTIATAAGITMSASVPTSTIAANVGLGLAQTWTNHSANALNVSGVVSGAFGLTKAGTGTLALSGANTYTGATTISAGKILNGSASTFTNKGGLSMSGTSIFDLGGFNAGFTTFASVAGNTITNSSAATGSSNATAPGTPSGAGVYVDALTFSNGDQTINANVTDGATRKTQVVIYNNLSATNLGGINNTANTFSGGLVLANATNGTRLRITTSIGSGTPFGTGPIIIGQANTDKAQILLDTVTNNTLANPIIFNTALGTDVAGGVRVDTAGNTLSGKLTANLANAKFNVAGSVSLTGQVTGAFGLEHNVRAGTVTLNNAGIANNYAGDTTIGTASINSILVLGRADQISNGSGAGNVILNGTLNLGGFSETINGLSGGSTGIVDGVSGTPLLTVGDNNATGASNTFAGVIKNTAGNLSLEKVGSGTLTLTGSNTNSGATSVSQGSLIVGNGTSGSLGNTSVTVGGNGSSGTPTLGGRGTIAGATAISSAGTGVVGTHAPGVVGANGGVGTQTFSNSLSYQSGSIFEWDLKTAAVGAAGTDFDAVALTSATGSLSVDDNATTGSIFKVVLGETFNGANAFWLSARSWDVFTATSGATLGSSVFARFQLFDTSSTTVPVNFSSFGSFGFTNTGSTGTLTWSAVPEPTSALAGLLIGAGLLRRRRR